MNSISPEVKEQRIVKTRSKTTKKDIKADAKIPISKKSKKTFKMKRGTRKGRGIIYIGHIPHGFYEDEMKSYFSQFGKVLATVVARSKKTGRSKGYGFVEFKDEEVAKIAAETMNNYLMFNRILKCRYIPPEEKRGRLNEGRLTAENFPRQKNRRLIERQKQEALSNLSQSAYLKKAQAKINKFKKFFEEKGIDFTFQLKSTDNSIKGSEKKGKTTSSTGSESESKDDKDDELGVLEIDESESEIFFKTPPQVKKVIKKSVTSAATPTKEFINSNNEQAGNKRINLIKKSGPKKTQKKEKNSQITKVTVSQKLNKKRKTQEKAEKCSKVNEFFTKDVSACTKLKKAKAKVSPLAQKKQKNTKSETGKTKFLKKGKK